MPLKIAAPCSINVCSMLVCAGAALAAFARRLRGAAANAPLVTFGCGRRAATGESLFNAVESQEVNLLLTGRRRCFGNVPCALLPTCAKVELGCRSRNLRAAVSTAFFSCVVQKTRGFAGIDSPWVVMIVTRTRGDAEVAGPRALYQRGDIVPCENGGPARLSRCRQHETVD